MSKCKGAIAAGHPETAKAAEMILKAGGNAFDAVVAAHFAACVAEPILTSFGGGGFLFGESVEKGRFVYDFFVQNPSGSVQQSTQFYPIQADFGSADQEFHIGAGSVAVPGTVKGIWKIYRELCSMPISLLAEPAISLAKNGTKLNRFQAEVMKIIRPILLQSPESRNIYCTKEEPHTLKKAGDIIVQPDLAAFIEQMCIEGDAFFYKGEISRNLRSVCGKDKGLITQADLENFEVHVRKPLRIQFRDSQIWMNPPPSSGGMLISFALKLYEKILAKNPKMDKTWLLARVQAATEKARADALAGGHKDLFSDLLDTELLKRYQNEIQGLSPSFRGTTQISIADEDGNVASLTTSNGEGSGIYIPGTGVMMNNMLGEADLNPAGFHTGKAGQRLTSMMAPGMMVTGRGKKYVFGSGGSNRIRTAILQVLLNITEKKMTLNEAVHFSRFHVENNFIHIEHGFEPDKTGEMQTFFSGSKTWSRRSLFFGGVHVVCRHENRFEAAADPRRGGVSVIL